MRELQYKMNGKLQNFAQGFPTIFHLIDRTHGEEGHMQPKAKLNFLYICRFIHIPI